MDEQDSINIILAPFITKTTTTGDFEFIDVSLNECFEIPSHYESAAPFGYPLPLRIKTNTFDFIIDNEDDIGEEENLISGKYIYYKSETEFIIKRLNLLTMKEQLEKIWQHYAPLLSSEIMQRGFMYCENSGPKDILITGINPSWREEKDKKDINHFRFNNDILFNPEGDVYWSPVKKMLHAGGPIDYRGGAAYLDILYFREKEQSKIRKEILKNEQGITFIAEQLNLTQHTIEEIIKPKVIVVKNRASAAYWGKAADEGIIWMGYSFKFIKPHRCGEICRIEGLIDSSERIAPEIIDTNLKGTIVLFAKHINQYTSKGERPTVEDVDELLELYKANNI